MIDDRFLLVRAVSVYIAAFSLILAAAWRRPDRAVRVGAFMALAWNIPALLVLHLAAAHFGWWHFEFTGGGLLGLPVDVWLAWAVLWGPFVLIAAPRAPLLAIVVLAVAIDLVLMPAAAPVVQLGPNWLIGELAAVLLCLVPAQLLGRWTATDQRLAARAVLQVAAFAILLTIVLPAIAIAVSDTSWAIPDLPRWTLSLLAQLLCVPALLGLTAVQEFVTRGGGTPVPFDPPRRLVTTGIYAYVANPMQLAAVVFLLILAAVIGNAYVAVAGIMGHLYSVGLAGWDEEQDLRQRFGEAWTSYRASSRKWLPRWRPRYVEPAAARLYVASDCDKCQQVAAWFRDRHAIALAVVPAETFPTPLTRVTYQSGDGSHTASGVHAVARALEHINLAWALIGFAIRLPLASIVIQLIVDASGGGPQSVAPAKRHESCDERRRIAVAPRL